MESHGLLSALLHVYGVVLCLVVGTPEVGQLHTRLPPSTVPAHTRVQDSSMPCCLCLLPALGLALGKGPVLLLRGVLILPELAGRKLPILGTLGTVK